MFEKASANINDMQAFLNKIAEHNENGYGRIAYQHCNNIPEQWYMLVAEQYFKELKESLDVYSKLFLNRLEFYTTETQKGQTTLNAQMGQLAHMQEKLQANRTHKELLRSQTSLNAAISGMLDLWQRLTSRLC